MSHPAGSNRSRSPSLIVGPNSPLKRKTSTLVQNDSLLQHAPQQLAPISMANTPATLSNLRINPLSNPRATKLVCELCGKPAYIQCKTCRLTFYCDKEHEMVDFKGIHEKICSYLIPLRAPVTVFGTEEERQLRATQKRQRQLKLLDITKLEAQKKMFEGQFEYAIPAALQSLRCTMDLYGQDSIELVPSYLLLGEASVGLQQYAQAEDYLSLAKWAVMKTKEECHPKVRSQLHRNFGMLYSAKGEYDEALKELAKDIFYSAVSSGPDHIHATGGYYQLGSVFQKQGKNENAAAVFDKVITIWKDYLHHENREPVNEAQQAEAIQMVSAIYSFRRSFLKSNTSFAEALYVLAQLYAINGKRKRALDNAEAALECKFYLLLTHFLVYELALGREHSLTVELRNFLKVI